MEAPKHILISRPDAIGDMVLTLPMAGLIKQHYPTTRVSVLGKNYTRDVVKCCPHVDAFYSLDDWRDEVATVQYELVQLKPDVVVHALPHKTVVQAAKQAKIPMRIGTGRRLHTLLRLTHPHFYSRKKSELHEAQLNLRLLTSLGITSLSSPKNLDALIGFKTATPAPAWSVDLVDPTRTSVILHPLSSGSAFDWPLADWKSLCAALDSKRFQLFITGTSAEGEKLREGFGGWPENATDLSGMFSLAEFIGFIGAVDALVACSTGPLHLAAISGIKAVGLYPTVRPMHAGRWAPLGATARVLESEDETGMSIAVQTVVDCLEG